MGILYNIGIKSYQGLVKFAGLFNTKARKLSEGESAVLDLLKKNLHPDGNYIWIHAASLGEFEQGRPLIEQIKANQPKQRILLTFFSPSGYEVRKNYDGVDFVSYLPFDHISKVKAFLDIVKPSKAIFVKYEFWSNYLHELQRRKIPTYIISAIFRKEQNFFRKDGNFFREMLHCFTHLYVQDEASKELLRGISVWNVTIAGDTRFDRVISIHRNAKELPLVKQFTDGHHTLVVGSSWLPDEQLITQYINAHTEQRLIIAPHEIHEEHIQQIESLLTRRTLRLSQANENNIQEAECLIIDSIGLLSSIYRYGKVAYIGGGFGAGIHNILEAAVYGMPVIFGPKYGKFREARNMIAQECAFSITNYNELESLLDTFATQPQQLAATGEKAGQFVVKNAGATDLIYDDIFDTLFGKKL